MPMGIYSASFTFQRLTNTVLSGLEGIKALIYLDDIVICGATLEEHDQRLVEVFDRLRVQSLKLEPDKYEFLRKEVYFWVTRCSHGREKDSSYKILPSTDYHRTVEGVPRTNRVLQKVRTAAQLDRQSLT
jgi:hypothetical protein